MVASLNALIEKHVPTLKKLGADLLSQMEQEDMDVHQICSISHMIKGSAGSLGFRDFSEFTAKIEARCKKKEASVITFDETIIEELRTIVEELSSSSSEIFQTAK